MQDELVQRIYTVVRKVPEGRVATYGQIAALAGLPGYARHVGAALRSLPDATALPWHRIVNGRGEISERPGRQGSARDPVSEQRSRLEAEDVEFNDHDRIALRDYQWRPRRQSYYS